MVFSANNITNNTPNHDATDADTGAAVRPAPAAAAVPAAAVTV
jgi:hypothetical protein